MFCSSSVAGKRRNGVGVAWPLFLLPAVTTYRDPSRAIAARAKADATAKRLMTIPGIGPVAATAIVALAPAASTFRRGRDFAAWLGLTPRQHSSGGKERLEIGRASCR